MTLRYDEPIPILTTRYTEPIEFLDNGEPLVEVTANTHPKIFVQSIYYQQGIPESLANIYIRQTVLERLKRVAESLPEHIALLLYDGYRPFALQQNLFQLIQEQIRTNEPHLTAEQLFQKTLTYVAFPSKERTASAPHLTGGAVDLTLMTIDGKVLPMGTAFDEVSEKSATAYFENNEENKDAQNNRRLLFHSMLAQGFSNYEEEWWHFEYGTKAWAARMKERTTKYVPIDWQR